MTTNRTTNRKPITSPLGESETSTVGAALQSALVDLVDLSLIAKQAHWNVVGRHFRDVHLHLDELVDLAREYTDLVAERAAAIGVSPDGRASTVAKSAETPEYTDGWHTDKETVTAIVKTLDGLVARMRTRVADVEEADPVTEDLFIQLTSKLEEARWMWQAQQA